jgi:hypothetical protein
MLSSLWAGGRLVLQYVLVVLLAATAWRVARRLVGEERGARLVAAALVFFSANVVLIAVPGILGWLTAPVVATLAGAYCLAMHYWLPSRLPAAAAAPAISPASELPAGAGAIERILVSRPAWLCVPFLLFTVPHVLRALLLVPIDWDSHCYHLFLPVQWIQHHRIGVFEAPMPYTAFNFYSKNFECTLTLSMLLASNDLLAKWFTWPCIALCGLVTGLLCRQLGGHRVACWASAATILTTTSLVMMSASTKPDPMVIFSVLSALWLLLRVLSKDGESRRLLFLAGLSCGLAVGGKFTALLPALVICLAVPFAAWNATRSLRGAVQGTAVFAVGGLLIGGWWYGWNFWITGNPVYPVSLGPFVGIKDDGWRYSILNQLHLLPWFWSYWDASAYPARAPMGADRMTYGPKFYLLVALLVTTLFGGVARCVKLLRRRNIADAVAWALTIACMLAALYTYFRAPYWRTNYFSSVVRVSLPVFGVAVAAGYALLSRPRPHPFAFWSLPLVGLVLDRRFIDFRMPDASGSVPVLLLGAVFAVLLIRFRSDWRICWGVIAVIGLLLPALHDYREANRYENYADWAEVHDSGYQRFASGAAWLQRFHPNAPVAVAFGTDFEFLYLYVGPDLRRRVDYIPAITTPRPSWESNGELRKGMDANAWRERVAKSEDEFLICHKWSQEMWPPERLWAQEFRMPLAYRSVDMEIYQLHGNRGYAPRP